MAHLNGWFVAVGAMEGALVSRDGIEWQPITAPSNSHDWMTYLTVSGEILIMSQGLNLYRGTFD